MWNEIVEQISEATGKAFRLAKASSVGGGCINETYRLDGDGGPFFAKLNRADKLEMFEAEADGLCDIAATETIRVPQPICHGISGGQAYLVLEHIELNGGGSQSELGRRLAKLHAVPQPHFGWRRDNTIGSTPQANPPRRGRREGIVDCGPTRGCTRFSCQSKRGWLTRRPRPRRSTTQRFAYAH